MLGEIQNIKKNITYSGNLESLPGKGLFKTGRVSQVKWTRRTACSEALGGSRN